MKEGVLMHGFPLGSTLLIVVSLLIFFGLAQRALDRMRLTDRQALLVIAAIILGGFVNIPLSFLPFSTSINVGGAIVPIFLAVYLLSKAGTKKEWARALLGAVITSGVVYLIGSVINTGSTMEPAGRFALVDAIYLYPLIGGLVAYIFGRSRRAAFISATLGILLVDIYHYFWLIKNKAPAHYAVMIGGGGAFDAIILAGIVAILLAEIIGETIERLAGGPELTNRPQSLLHALQAPDNQPGYICEEEKNSDKK
jgi:uncharacterized membrane protein